MNPDEKKVKLCRALSKMGVTSRTLAIEAILAGRVTVNNRIERDPGALVRPGRDALALSGEVVRSQEKAYLLLHKPKGVVTTRRDPEQRKTVYDLLPHDFGWIAPIGRLDKNTSGLLLFTNDTAYADRITSPDSQIPKTYLAKVDRKVEGDVLARLRHGVTLDDGTLAIPEEASLFRQNAKTAWIRLVLTEGKNREVRRILKAVGYEVENLIRIRIGDLELGDLEPGEWRKLGRDETAKATVPLRVRTVGT